MKLSVGDKAAFRWYDGTTIVGEVVSIVNGWYHVISPSICTMYSDGLFRFRDHNVY